MDKHSYVYIMTNAFNTVLYVGVTTDLKRRVWEHKEKLAEGFTKRYNVTKLVYYETGEDVMGAIAREKQIKGGSRIKKVRLVESMNKEWRDLYYELWRWLCRSSQRRVVVVEIASPPDEGRKRSSGWSRNDGR